MSVFVCVLFLSSLINGKLESLDFKSLTAIFEQVIASFIEKTSPGSTLSFGLSSIPRPKLSEIKSNCFLHVSSLRGLSFILQIILEVSNVFNFSLYGRFLINIFLSPGLAESTIVHFISVPKLSKVLLIKPSSFNSSRLVSALADLKSSNFSLALIK